MEGVLPNGEPKKIVLTQPTPECVQTQPEPSTSRFSVEVLGQSNRVYIPPSRRRPLTENSKDEEEEHVTNHKKQRYWNSFEEMYIVELWRRFRDEVTEFNKPLPVHRKIMVAMRQKEMMVTGQDCRRKLNTLNNRYKAELESQRLTGIKPQWRLFPLIHCVKSPKIKQFDPWHEPIVIRRLLEKIPKPPEVKIHPKPLTVPSPARPPLVTSKTHTNRPGNAPTTVPVTTTTTTTNPSTPLLSYIPPMQTAVSGMATLVGMDNCMSAVNNEEELQSRKEPLVIGHITLKRLEQLQFENLRLSKERDEALRALKTDERNLRLFEALLKAVVNPSENNKGGVAKRKYVRRNMEKNVK
ncbi:uncharacterized protein LOC142224127 [Haematobia irritans]|uniref:uncharacterized protein LOC142224127 n=1 Tax=Haematobia irritans TaxID=7368 RepID=UPI003F50648C